MFKIFLFAILAIASSAPIAHHHLRHHHQRTYLTGSVGLGLNSGYGYGYGLNNGYGYGLNGYQTGLIRSPYTPLLGGSIVSPLGNAVVNAQLPFITQPIAQPIYGSIGLGNGGAYLGSGIIG